MWIYTSNKLAKFHGNILSLSENIAKTFRGGGYFFWLTLYIPISFAVEPSLNTRTCVCTSEFRLWRHAYNVAGSFVMLAMSMSTLSVVTTITVIYFHYNNGTRPVPRWIQRIAFDGLARVMCMEITVGGDRQRSKNKPDQRDLKAYTVKSFLCNFVVENIFTPYFFLQYFHMPTSFLLKKERYRWSK